MVDAPLIDDPMLSHQPPLPQSTLPFLNRKLRSGRTGKPPRVAQAPTTIGIQAAPEATFQGESRAAKMESTKTLVIVRGRRGGEWSFLKRVNRSLR